jgi:Fe-S cluster biosynthesis and repair protein YggX
MTRKVTCVKLGKEAEGLDNPPFPGEKGQKIFDTICKEAWQLWQQRQTMLINEHRLSVVDPKAREYLEQQMQLFLFEDGGEMPQGYVPEE